MELWIRSQNRKKLCKATNLHIKTHTTYSNYGSYEQIAIFNDNIILGDYEEERALEVLDEIQKYINNECKFLEREQHTSMGTYKNKEKMCVYEMPKD